MTQITITTDANVPAGYEDTARQRVTEALTRVARDNGVNLGPVNVQIGGDARAQQGYGGNRVHLDVDASVDGRFNDRDIQNAVTEGLRRLARDNGVDVRDLTVQARRG